MKATWPAAFGALVASTGAPIVAAAGGMILLGACTSCQSTVREAAIPVIAAGSFDGVEADQRAHRLYLGDSRGDEFTRRLLDPLVRTVKSTLE